MHEKFEDLLLLYTTHSISAEQLHDLQAHLAQCSQCRQSLNEWRAIADAVKARAYEKAYLQEPPQMTTRMIPMQRRERPLAMALALVAIVCIVVILFANRPSLPNVAQQSTQVSGDFLEVIIAAQPIENGAVIHEDDVMLYQMPAQSVPASARTNLSIDNVVGRIATTNIACGQIFVSTFVVQNARSVPDEQLSFREQEYACRGTLAPLEEPIEFVDMIVAAQNIPVNAIVPNDFARVIHYPAQLVPIGAITNLQDILRHRALTFVYLDQIVMSEFLDPNAIPEPTISPITADMPQPVCQLNFAGENVPVRSAPNENAEILSELFGTIVFDVIETALDDDSQLWYHIYIRGSFSGWLYHDVVTSSTCQSIIPVTLTSTSVPMTTLFPTRTPTPNVTSTPAALPTVMLTPTVWVITVTPMSSSTPAGICQVTSITAADVRMRPTLSSLRIAFAEIGLVMNVQEIELGEDNFEWYHVRVQLAYRVELEGWVRSDDVQPVDGRACPTLSPAFMTTTPLPTPLTPIYTVTPGATFSANATLTSTPAALCQVVADENINLRLRPSRIAEMVAVSAAGMVMDVIEIQLGDDDFTWYRVHVSLPDGAGFEGWIRSDTVRQETGWACPTLP